ncbi:MAG: transketolase [Anaerolineae bacterium]|nr:transketolase [Anaerolineae bacterium]
MSFTTLDEKSINTIRFLAVDAVQKAKSGHPGMPMGSAVMAYTLWTRHLRFNPRNPQWPDRDRFILSAGHGSTLLYSLLHLTGYDLPMEELASFRQWESLTPGHPESHLTPGVEVTTGPLGQGFANGVGMAVAERFLAERFNTGDHKIVDHYIYAIVSDGDLQEGVASEAASYAGTQRLSKLIYLYDDNDISIEGDTDVTFREDVGARFRAYDWNVIGPIDGMSVDAVDAAIAEAKLQNERPTLIICRTVIGYGSPNKAGTASSHGEPLGEEEVALTKQNLNWPQDQRFLIPDDVLENFRGAVERGSSLEAEWRGKLDAYRAAYSDKAVEFERLMRGELPMDWQAGLPTFSPDTKIATRVAGGKVINGIAGTLENLVGGSADLTPSTKTWIDASGRFGWEKGGRNLQFGIREHAMGSIAVGMACHGGVIPYTATFMVFSDYMRPPIRLAAIANARVIFVFTHDSIGLGEDGPTHQPVEHLATLRVIPNLWVIRPADANETAEAWRQAILRSDGPTVIALTRQNLPVLDRSKVAPAGSLSHGAYILKDTTGTPEVILIGTGSEVPLVLDAADQLAAQGIKARVVSMPCWELFERQPQSYRDAVFPPEVRARLAVEAASPMGWHRWVGDQGDIIALDRFGASAPIDVLMKEFGFTVENVVARAKMVLGRGA